MDRDGLRGVGRGRFVVRCARGMVNRGLIDGSDSTDFVAVSLCIPPSGYAKGLAGDGLRQRWVRLEMRPQSGKERSGQ